MTIFVRNTSYVDITSSVSVTYYVKSLNFEINDYWQIICLMIDPISIGEKEMKIN